MRFRHFIAAMAIRAADLVHFLERSLAPEREDRVTAAEESLAHPSFSSAGDRYVHACSGSLPNVFSGRESSEVRRRQVSIYSRGSTDPLYSFHPPLGAERRSLNQGALYVAGLTLSLASTPEFIRALTATTCRDGHSATVNATPVEVNMCSAMLTW